MDNLGVAINETTLANYALEKGLKKSTQAMTTQEKVGLAMQMFLERTAEYAGNYAKENDTLAGAMQTAKAAWDNLLSGAEKFTAADFVDSMENMFRVLTRNVTKIVPRLTSSFAEIGKRAVPKMKEWFTAFWNVDLPKMATDAVNGIISKINSIFGTDFKPIEPIKLPKAEEISEKLKGIWDTVTATIGNAFTWTLGLFTPPDGDAVIDSVFGLSSWWYDTVLPFIQETFRWTVGLFQPPGEGVDPNGYIAAWWTDTVLPFLNETCTWVLNMFLPPDENGDITPESVIKGWWDNVSGLVEAACTWVLGIFEAPEEDGDQAASVLYYWWNNVRQSIVDACKWALGLFGTPVESLADIESIMSTWWSGVVTTVTDACVWFLNLFKAPKSAEDGNGPGAIMATWWNGVVDTVVGACTWFLGLFSGVSKDSDAEGNIVTPLKIVTDWWNDTVDTVVGVCKWLLGHFTGVSDETDANGQAKSVSAIVTAWWEDTVDAVIKACGWVLGLFTGVSEKTDAEGKPATAAGIVGSWWETVRAGVIAACTWTIGLFTGVAETNAEGEGADGIVSRWWGTVVDSVVAACQWTLNLFMPPDEDVDADGSFTAWWTNNAAPALKELSAWTIGMFMPPDDDIDSSGAVFAWWHNTALPALDDICQWALGMFGVPVEEVDGDGLFSTWWNNTASPIVQGICQWALSLFSGVSDTNQEGNSLWDVITGWWNNQVKLVQTACDWALGLFSGVLGDEKPDGTRTTAADVVKVWWDNTKASVIAVCQWALGLFDAPEKQEGEGAKTPEGIIKTWWDTVKANVIAACQWALGLFGAPNASGMSIWSLVSTWWSNQKRFAESALVWTLQLFGVPTETADQVKTTVSGWWSGVVGAVQEACGFVAHLTGFDPPAEGDITTWWGTVKGNIEKTLTNLGGIAVKVSKLIFTSDPIIDLSSILSNASSFAADMTGMLQGIAGNNDLMALLKTGGLAAGASALISGHPLIAGIALLIANWDTLKQLVEVTGEAIDTFFNKDLPETWNKLCEGAKQIWNDNVVTPIQNAIAALQEFFGLRDEGGAVYFGENGEFGGASGEQFDVPVEISKESEANMQEQLNDMGLSSPVTMVPDFSKIPNFSRMPPIVPEATFNPYATTMYGKAVGLNYVPYNEFPSLLHEGEAVLTKAQATAWRRGEGTEGVSIDYDRMAEIVANAVVQAVSGLAIQMDKQTVGTIVSPVVFNEMGRQLNRKRFAT